jgi:hypothetical protein
LSNNADAKDSHKKPIVQDSLDDIDLVINASATKK